MTRCYNWHGSALRNVDSTVAATGDQVPRNPKGREHRPLPEKITDLAADVLDGTIRLPKFQRDFVWTRQQVLDLLDSIARGYPIGSFLLWKSPVNLASESSIAGLVVETRRRRRRDRIPAGRVSALVYHLRRAALGAQWRSGKFLEFGLRP